MKFYTKQQKFHCGIDLHTKMIFVCILDQKANILVHKNIPTDAQTFVDLIQPYREDLIVGVEDFIVKHAKQYDPRSYYRLQTVPGIGLVLALTILYEIQDIHRFPAVQDFCSYSRLVKCAKESAGKNYGYSGGKIGNAHLKWAFSEAAALLIRESPLAKQFVEKNTRRESDLHVSPQARSCGLFYFEEE